MLRRIARGLDIPPEMMGLSWWGPDGTWYGPGSAYPEEVTVADPQKGVSAEMLRRHLLALGAVTAFGAPVKNLGELLELPGATPDRPLLPSRLSEVHVAQVRDLTRRLGETGKAHGSTRS